MENLKYSNHIGDIASTVIIDGVVCKCRDMDFQNATKNYISNAKDNFEDIIIQDGRYMEIYSSEHKLEHYLQVCNSLSLSKIENNEKYCNVAIFYMDGNKIKNQMYI